MSTTQPPETEAARRPLRSRQTGWAKGMAQFLARKRVSPNSISVMSVVFSAGAAGALWFLADASGLQRVWLLLAAVAGIQLRLVCNLLDGMVAVEGGLKTKSGEIFNDFPDRVSDTVILLAAGHAADIFPYGSILGWSAALLAAFTAYVRLLGGSCGLKQNFIGPMAKQHRMAVLTVTCLASMVVALYPNVGLFTITLAGRTEAVGLQSGPLLWVALVVINIGCVLTVFRRLSRLKRELEAR